MNDIPDRLQNHGTGKGQCWEDTFSSGVPAAVARQTPADGTLQSTEPGGVLGVVGQRFAHSEPKY